MSHDPDELAVNAWRSHIDGNRAGRVGFRSA